MILLNVFFDLGIMIVFATILAHIARYFKQPLIPAYIISGLLLGPILGWISDSSTIMILSEIGIAFLLFIVGMEIDLKRLKTVFLVSVIGGVLQVIILFSLGYVFAVFFGFSLLEAAYIGMIIAFSSTMVVVKLLSDKHELDTLHGRIVLGILLMQDIIAILLLSIMNTVDNFSTFFILLALFKGLTAILISSLCALFIFPSLFKFAAKSREYLFLLSIAVCFVFAMLFHLLGFSIAIGAFIAGVSLANLPWKIEIEGLVTSIKDFFAIIFFISLGLQLTIGSFENLFWPFIALLLFTIIAKPIVLMLICGLFGYKKRPAFLSALTLAQSSEFSLILVAQGLVLNHIGKDIFTMSVFLGLITITLTSYFINFDSQIYKAMSKYLGIFERVTKGGAHLEYLPKRRKKYDVILCGNNRIGYGVFETVRKQKKSLLVIDFNPDIIRKLIKMKVSCIYGDVGDHEVLNKIDFSEAKILISTIPDHTDSHILIKKARNANKKLIIIVTSNQVDDALELYDAGADYVILPHYLGGQHVSFMLQDFHKDVKNVIKARISHIKELKRRHNIGHRKIKK